MKHCRGGKGKRWSIVQEASPEGIHADETQNLYIALFIHSSTLVNDFHVHNAKVIKEKHFQYDFAFGPVLKALFPVR